MKQTLLDLVQEIGYMLELGDISSISDTYESEQVSRVIKRTYEALIVRNKWPHLDRFVDLVMSSDVTKPTHVTMKDEVSHIWEVEYNISKDNNTVYELVRYVEPDLFLRKANTLLTTSVNTLSVVDASGAEFFVRNDAAPTYYTSFNDRELVFNSFDEDKGNTLLSGSLRVRGKIKPKFILDDTYIPDLPEEAFPLLFEESLSRASVIIRQEVNNKAEQESQRQSRWLSRNNGRAAEQKVKYPNYGRRV